MDNDQYYMQLVLDMAASVGQQTLPNPQVAAILVNNGQIVGVGNHLCAGYGHAEVYALAQAGAKAAGATLYVNLEPCAHFGRTPPCAAALIAAKIQRIVISHIDPNPLVAGKGIAMLEAAGVQVEVGLLATQAMEINKVFMHNVQSQQPYVSLKVGMSLDGKIATKTNSSKWITTPESRQDAHIYRAQHSGILVGVNTVISDDPTLTPYLIPDASAVFPTRIILDRNLRTPLQAKLLSDKLAPTWICTCNTDSSLHKKYRDFGVKILEFSGLNISLVLKKLYQEQIYSLLVEGGEQVYASFIDSKQVNQLICYLSPQLIGSSVAKQFYAGGGFSDLMDNLKLKFEQVTNIGQDIKIVARVKNGETHVYRNS